MKSNDLMLLFPFFFLIVAQNDTELLSKMQGKRGEYEGRFLSGFGLWFSYCEVLPVLNTASEKKRALPDLHASGGARCLLIRFFRNTSE